MIREEIRRNRLARLCEMASNLPFSDVQFASEYAEPGYSSPDSGVILFADWNTRGCKPITPSNRQDRTNIVARIGRLAERLGAECEWSDEWSTCSDCGKAVRTQPDSCSWLPSYVLGHGYLKCRECVEADPSVDEILNDPRRADTMGLDLRSLGFVLWQGDAGQDSEPETLSASVPPGFDFAFQIEGKGRFNCWIRPKSDDVYMIDIGHEPNGTVCLKTWQDRTEPPLSAIFTPVHRSELRSKVEELRAYGFQRIGVRPIVSLAGLK